MCQSSQSEHDAFRILLYRNDSAKVLVETTDNGLRLPAIVIPPRARVAEEITAAIEKRWNVVAYCLFLLPSDTCSRELARYQVAEVSRADSKPRAEIRWVPTESLSAGQFAEAADFEAIQKSYTTLDRYRKGTLPGFFGKPGWLRVVTDWVAENAAVSGLRLTGKFRQFDSSPTFSLLRFETNGPALWFKAVGEPNVHEHALTLHLAPLFPGRVPHVIASNREWNAWLSVEAKGRHLSNTSPIIEWQNVATALAHLQIASFGNGLHLIDAGCRDVRACSLLERVGPFFDCMAELMASQTKPTPPPLTTSELAVLAEEIRKALEELGENGIPNLLGHLDCNPENILISPERCVFLDWAEGCVGHPFFTFQYLLEYWRRFHGTDASAESTILSAYTTPWQSFVSSQQIAAAFQLTPLLAAFTYAASAHQLRSQTAVRRPETAASLRGLTRRMKREADTLQQRRLTCVL
jgi:hypothetical protein